MATKPSKLPRWADVGGDIVEPTEDKKDKGWTPAERPPAQYKNWLQNLNYQWLAFLDPFFDDDGHYVTAEQFVAGPDQGDHLQEWKGLDPGGNVRASVDHLGFRMGQVSEWEEHWRTAGTTDPVGWTITLAGGSKLYQDPGATPALPARSLRLRASGSGDASTATPEYTARVTRDTVLAMEWDVVTDPEGEDGGSGGGHNECGVQFDHAGGNDQFLYFHKRHDGSGNANWRCVDSADAFDGDSGVVWAGSTVYKFRLEVIGKNVLAAGGDDWTVRWWIDDVMVAEHTTSSFGGINHGDNARFYANVKNSGGGGGAVDQDLVIGRIRLCWSHHLAPAYP